PGVLVCGGVENGVPSGFVAVLWKVTLSPPCVSATRNRLPTEFCSVIWLPGPPGKVKPVSLSSTVSVFVPTPWRAVFVTRAVICRLAVSDGLVRVDVAVRLSIWKLSEGEGPENQIVPIVGSWSVLSLAMTVLLEHASA